MQLRQPQPREHPRPNRQHGRPEGTPPGSTHPSPTLRDRLPRQHRRQHPGRKSGQHEAQTPPDFMGHGIGRIKAPQRGNPHAQTHHSPPLFGIPEQEDPGQREHQHESRHDPRQPFGIEPQGDSDPLGSQRGEDVAIAARERMTVQRKLVKSEEQRARQATQRRTQPAPPATQDHHQRRNHHRTGRPHRHRHRHRRAAGHRPSHRRPTRLPTRTPRPQRRHQRGQAPDRGRKVAQRLQRAEESDRADHEHRRTRPRQRPRHTKFARRTHHQQWKRGRQRYAHNQRPPIPTQDQARQRELQRQTRGVRRYRLTLASTQREPEGHKLVRSRHRPQFLR